MGLVKWQHLLLKQIKTNPLVLPKWEPHFHQTLFVGGVVSTAASQQEGFLHEPGHSINVCKVN